MKPILIYRLIGFIFLLLGVSSGIDYAYTHSPIRLGISVSQSLPWIFYYTRKYDVSDFFLLEEMRKSGQKVYVSFELMDDKLHGRKPYLLKEIACWPGNHLKCADETCWCDFLYLGKSQVISKTNMIIIPFEYEGVIPENHYFMLGYHERSYDSRYFGLINRGQIRNIAYPLW